MSFTPPAALEHTQEHPVLLDLSYCTFWHDICQPSVLSTFITGDPESAFQLLQQTALFVNLDCAKSLLNVIRPTLLDKKTACFCICGLACSSFDLDQSYSAKLALIRS